MPEATRSMGKRCARALRIDWLDLVVLHRGEHGARKQKHAHCRIGADDEAEIEYGRRERIAIASETEIGPEAKERLCVWWPAIGQTIQRVVFGLVLETYSLRKHGLVIVLQPICTDVKVENVSNRYLAYVYHGYLGRIWLSRPAYNLHAKNWHQLPVHLVPQLGLLLLCPSLFPIVVDEDLEGVGSSCSVHFF